MFLALEYLNCKKAGVCRTDPLSHVNCLTVNGKGEKKLSKCLGSGFFEIPLGSYIARVGHQPGDSWSLKEDPGQSRRSKFSGKLRGWKNELSTPRSLNTMPVCLCDTFLDEVGLKWKTWEGENSLQIHIMMAKAWGTLWETRIRVRRHGVFLPLL